MIKYIYFGLLLLLGFLNTFFGDVGLISFLLVQYVAIQSVYIKLETGNNFLKYFIIISYALFVGVFDLFNSIGAFLLIFTTSGLIQELFLTKIYSGFSIQNPVGRIFWLVGMITINGIFQGFSIFDIFVQIILNTVISIWLISWFENKLFTLGGEFGGISIE